MLKYLPRFSEQFHLAPADFWALTQEEFEQYMNAAEATDRANDGTGSGEDMTPYG